MQLTPIQQQFQVTFRYTVHFTENLFSLKNPLLSEVVASPEGSRKVLFVIDHHVAQANPDLLGNIQKYTAQHAAVMQLVCEPIIIPGGEQCKNKPELAEQIIQVINDFGIDRHSYVLAIGGGAVLDMVGYAAGIAHRGIRHIRIPTTVLAQNDSGVGVKNSINAFSKKNFLGTFTPPDAVINDFHFLRTLTDREWRAGIAEAIKVALIKDADFFKFIQDNAVKLAQRDMPAMQYLIHRCAEMHVRHIASGDPFEKGSSRPLDFGHWSAHKLEQLSNYRIRHGEAVAMGIALDATYSCLKGLLTEAELQQILAVIKTVGFELFAPEMHSHLHDASHPESLLRGLQEFREHLGGQLTIMLLARIGHGVEVHEIDNQLMIRAIEQLQSA